jgi:hypothetical protein
MSKEEMLKMKKQEKMKKSFILEREELKNTPMK